MSGFFKSPKDTTAALIESTELVAKLQDELAAARAEIGKQTRGREVYETGYHQLYEELAAEQAKNVGLQEALENLVRASAVCLCHFETDHTAATEALSAPSDTSALEAYVANAGEKMRERAKLSLVANEEWAKNYEAIRALPGVTLEDLSKSP